MIKKLVANHVDQNLTKWYEKSLVGYLATLPDEAQASACIDKINRGYVGVIDIELADGHFIAKAIKKDPCDLMATLLTEIYQQVIDWKTGRYFAS